MYMYFRNERRFAVIEHLISAVNTFVLSIAQNSRAQVCKFGESICINMLYLWENRPSNMLKVWILGILRFWNVSCENFFFFNLKKLMALFITGGDIGVPQDTDGSTPPRWSQEGSARIFCPWLGWLAGQSVTVGVKVISIQ